MSFLEPRALWVQQEGKMSTKRKADSHSKAACRPRFTKSGKFQTEAERDSGFSGGILLLMKFKFSIHKYHYIRLNSMLLFSGTTDASSEHMSAMDTTDSEDSPCPVAQQGPQTPSSGPATPQLAVVGGSYPSLSPMIFMNNVLLKQVQCCYYPWVILSVLHLSILV